jgi:hypothetical protein
MFLCFFFFIIFYQTNSFLLDTALFILKILFKLLNTILNRLLVVFVIEFKDIHKVGVL